jgi:hypothetical protein
MFLCEPMSEFKFACPVCGQHITADSTTSGTQIDCPTCFQKLIIPQAPTGSSKLIVSAVQVGKPRPTQSDALWQESRPITARRMSVAAFVASALVVVAAAGTIFVFREKIVRLVRNQGQPKTIPKPQVRSRAVYPIPTNTAWNMNLSRAVIPNAPAAGGIRGLGFFCEHASIQGGNLTLRQGRTWPPDLGITVHLFARQGEELSGKTVEVAPDRSPPLPKVVLRWRDEQNEPRKQEFAGGYALKMIFGAAENSRIPGKIFLSLPDEGHSFLAGTFDADIRQPPPPKPGKAKTP